MQFLSPSARWFSFCFLQPPRPPKESNHQTTKTTPQQNACNVHYSLQSRPWDVKHTWCDVMWCDAIVRLCDVVDCEAMRCDVTWCSSLGGDPMTANCMKRSATRPPLTFRTFDAHFGHFVLKKQTVCALLLLKKRHILRDFLQKWNFQGHQILPLPRKVWSFLFLFSFLHLSDCFFSFCVFMMFTFLMISFLFFISLIFPFWYVLVFSCLFYPFLVVDFLMTYFIYSDGLKLRMRPTCPPPPQIPGQHARLRGCPGGDFIYLLRHFWAVFEDPYTTFYLLNVSLECDANWALNTSIFEDPCEALGYFFQSLECGH